MEHRIREADYQDGVCHEHRIRETDYQDGASHEQKIFNKLQQMGYTIEPTSRYKYFDCLIDDKYICEVKKRSVNKDRYDTTILPISKIKQYELQHKKTHLDMIMIFSFQDGCYYTSYNDLRKNKKKFKIDTFTRYSGFEHKPKPHIFIKTELLKPLDQIRLKC